MKKNYIEVLKNTYFVKKRKKILFLKVRKQKILKLEKNFYLSKKKEILYKNSKIKPVT